MPTSNQRARSTAPPPQPALSNRCIHPPCRGARWSSARRCAGPLAEAATPQTRLNTRVGGRLGAACRNGGQRWAATDPRAASRVRPPSPAPAPPNYPPTHRCADSDAQEEEDGPGGSAEGGASGSANGDGGGAAASPKPRPKFFKVRPRLFLFQPGLLIRLVAEACLLPPFCSVGLMTALRSPAPLQPPLRWLPPGFQLPRLDQYGNQPRMQRLMRELVDAGGCWGGCWQGGRWVLPAACLVREQRVCAPAQRPVTCTNLHPPAPTRSARQV